MAVLVEKESVKAKESVQPTWPKTAHAPVPANSIRSWVFWSLSLALLLFLTVSILRHPLATNDGPVHAAFSHLLLTYHQPAQPMQSLAYTLDLRPKPNLTVYLLMALLMRVFSTGVTESIIQVLCIVCPFFAAYFALRSIHPKNAWLSLFLVPLALNQMFFLGLYNHELSTAAFFLVIGTYFWMLKAPGYRRALLLACSVLLTFLCHASGLVMSLTGLIAMSTTDAVLTARRQRSIVAALKAQRFTALAIIAPLPFIALFMGGGGTSITIYSIPFRRRLWDFLKLHLLSVNYWQRDHLAAIAISALLLAAFGFVVVRLIRQRSGLPQARQDQQIAAIVATLAAIAVMFAFPDVMGGGWTHFRRFEIYPYFWILLVLAFEDFSARAFALFAAVAGSAAIVLITSTVSRQAAIREQMAPLYQADSLIGSHCTVAPLVLEPELLDRNSNIDYIDYQPFYQSASRLELHGDRVVLFNYLARLPPYPVHFRPEAEPQANLFLWKPQQIKNEVEHIDLPGYEAGSGLRVDYILLWGRPSRQLPAIRAQVENALGQFDEIYHSDSGVVKLYRRRGVHNALCTMDSPAIHS
jgi:hypothetical protein